MNIVNDAVTNARIFPLPDNVSIALPNNAKLMTPFIIAEQGDWFEDEIRWMRRMLRPGMRVLDIGANYGCYSLSAAGAVGEEGQVWSVEPTPAVLAHLEKSKEANGFQNMSILPYALGRKNGEVSFFIGEHPELNAMERELDSQEEVVVPCRTLDALVEAYEIDSVDFLKLDAEGQEEAILESGHSVFAQQSPAVLFEIMHAEKLHLDFWRALKPLGYEPYALCPGIGVMIPVEPESLHPGSALNLIACKPDRAELLEKQGLLVRNIALENEEAAEASSTDYKDYLRGFSYGRELEKLGVLDLAESEPGHEAYAIGMNLYAKAMAENCQAGGRVRLALAAFAKIREACTVNATVARMLTFIRLGGALRDKQLASTLLEKLVAGIKAGEELSISEAFLNPAADYDNVDATNRIGEFIQSAILYQAVRWCGYSSCFRLNDAVSDINAYREQGIEHPNMTRVVRAIEWVSETVRAERS